MINVTKTVTDAAKAGATLYVAAKVTDTAGQLALNFMPSVVPKAASVLLGGLGVSVALKQFGKGRLVHDLADFAAATAVAGAIRNVGMVDKSIDRLLAPVKKIGANPATKALIDASVKGYFDEGMSGYEMAGYEEAPTLRGMTSVHGF